MWMFNGWFSSEFWRQNLHEVSCSEDEMEEAVDGAFITGFYFKNPSQERGVSGLTGKELWSSYITVYEVIVTG